MARRKYPSRPRYELVQAECTPSCLVIRDLSAQRGRHRGVSITNAAEVVVAELHAAGHLPTGRRLYYYDTGGDLDELLHDAGAFVGYAPGPDRSRSQMRRDLDRLGE